MTFRVASAVAVAFGAFGTTECLARAEEPARVDTLGGCLAGAGFARRAASARYALVSKVTALATTTADTQAAPIVAASGVSSRTRVLCEDLVTEEGWRSNPVEACRIDGGIRGKFAALRAEEVARIAGEDGRGEGEECERESSHDGSVFRCSEY